MYQKIEDYLFEGAGTHALIRLTLINYKIELILAPWSNLQLEKTFSFLKVKHLKVDLADLETADESSPMDIIGVTCEQLSGEEWSFGFHCGEGEVHFESLWPSKKT